MRVLHVTDTFLPRIGGIELHVDDLAARQRAYGDEALVLTAERALAWGGPLRSPSGVPVVRLRAGLGGIGAAFALGPLVASFDPDVVHAHLTVGSPFTWSVLRNTAGIPAMATLHSLLPDAPALVRAGVLATGLPAGRITFTAVSEVAARRLAAALRKPVHVLHNGIDPGGWQVEHRPTGAFHLVSVGRLAARKRPLVLVQALADLAAAAPGLPWTATIVGDGAQRAKVATAIRAHGLGGRVRLLGTLDRGAIKALLGTADVFVAPAQLESFGVAALEARCAGVPIVGMAGSGLTEFVTDGVDGLLAGRDADLAGCLHRLATDRALLERIRAHNGSVPVPMDWAAVLAEHRRRYDAVVHAGRSAYALAGIGYEPGPPEERTGA